MSDETMRRYVLGEEPHGAGRWAMLLVNPYTRIAGWQAFGWGMVILAATVAVAVLGQVHYDGVMDLHVGPATVPEWLYAFEPVVDWLSVALVFWLAGAVFSRSKQRVIDYFGTTALGRAPYLIAGILWMRPLLGGTVVSMVEGDMSGSLEDIAGRVLSLPGLPWLIAGSLVTVLLIAWLAVMNYFALKESSGMKHGRAVPVFLGAAIVAEVISKVAIGLAAYAGGVI